eukprot:CAMPEP_0197179806 /NCGR_PEP_ID=MMETSP1423-20130617/4635_1 /TAXON_ID=476441 /ORGANISM="Pseudo-nitzschia heimii, Strain UNC1101" /LENGTH=251 /DNA_ID=CAMNT_0042629771 /DNA_START=170 /DNA_END=925 /DNA_ORIENTATION=+
MTVSPLLDPNDPVAAMTVVENPPTTKDVATEGSYWNTFYSEVASFEVPSQFCIMVSTEVDRSTPIVEFGCGNGRDSLFFSSKGFKVIGSDLSPTAIAKNRAMAPAAAASASGLTEARFEVCDVTDAAKVGELVGAARDLAAESGSSGGGVVVYNRFFLHSIDRVQESRFVEALSESMRSGDKLYMEFRCHLDEDLPKVYGKGHYRRYVQTDDFVATLEKLGYRVEYEVTGRGMSKYKSEDPFVSRVIAVKA